MITVVMVSTPCCIHIVYMFPMKSGGTMLHLCDFTTQQQELLQILRTPKESWGLFVSQPKPKKTTRQEGGTEGMLHEAVKF